MGKSTKDGNSSCQLPCQGLLERGINWGSPVFQLVLYSKIGPLLFPPKPQSFFPDPRVTTSSREMRTRRGRTRCERTDRSVSPRPADCPSSPCPVGHSPSQTRGESRAGQNEVAVSHIQDYSFSWGGCDLGSFRLFNN